MEPWADDLVANRRSILLLRRLHSTTAIRIVMGYQTVSYASATVLLASPPFEFQALSHRSKYKRLSTRDSVEKLPNRRLETFGGRRERNRGIGGGFG